MSNLLTTIQAPNLGDPNYAQNLSQAFQNINENFNKLVSVPFLQGPEGEGFEAVTVSLFDINEGETPTIYSKLNDFGINVVKTIFDEVTNWKTWGVDDDKKTLSSLDSLDEFKENGVYKFIYESSTYYYAYDNITLNNYLQMYVIYDSSGQIKQYYLGQYYHHKDNRLAAIKNRPSFTTEDLTEYIFSDSTCFLSYEPNYLDSYACGTFSKISSIPTLYYNGDLMDWCWQINGTKTNISARGSQGIDGEKGSLWYLVKVNTLPSYETSDINDLYNTTNDAFNTTGGETNMYQPGTILSCKVGTDYKCKIVSVYDTDDKCWRQYLNPGDQERYEKIMNNISASDSCSVFIDRSEDGGSVIRDFAYGTIETKYINGGTLKTVVFSETYTMKNCYEQIGIGNILDNIGTGDSSLSVINGLYIPVEKKKKADGTLYGVYGFKLYRNPADTDTTEGTTEGIEIGVYDNGAMKTNAGVDAKYKNKTIIIDPDGFNKIEFTGSIKGGLNNTASGEYSHAEGYDNTASGTYSHAEGEHNTASGTYSHAEGYDNTASVEGSHAEGRHNTASGKYSHAEGYDNTASVEGSHAEGRHNTASGLYSHAEGYYNTASGTYSHAEGYDNTASGEYSHAEGEHNEVSGRSAAVFGKYNKNSINCAVVCGKYNKNYTDSAEVYFIVGNGSGTEDIDRSNALEVWTTEIKSNVAISAPSFYQTSDERLKNIHNNDISLEKCYELLEKCRLIEYDLKDDNTHSAQIGLIAQEVEQFFPELVKTDKDGYKSVDYSRLTVILLKLTKELLYKYNNLENRLKVIESLLKKERKL